MTRKLLLFDIDGTLINPDNVGRRSITKAFHDLCHIADAFAEINMAGKTDVQIVKEGLSTHGLSSNDGRVSAVLSQYIKNLEAAAKQGTMSIYPGVIDLLKTFKARDGSRLGLLTGNIEQGARIKLGALELNQYFSFGAFGDDSEDRNKLLPIAVKRSREISGVEVAFHDCIVIGDTPMDVQCAKPYGATAIAVSTGFYSHESLLETEADYVIRDLSDAIGLIDSIA